MKKLKLAITCGALLLLFARMVWPELKVDSITLGLLIVAVIPWMTSLIESARFPGGWEIKFRDLSQAGEKITSAAGVAKPTALPDFLAVVESDPNLALVGLRIEIEKRLRILAAQLNIADQLPLTRLFGELYQKGLLAESVFGALQEIVRAGTKAAHGASVEPSVRDWALNTGPEILGVLDGLLVKDNDHK
jgi:hypothetical protein